jgi:hypothetical protein
MGSVTATNVGLFDLSTPLSTGPSAGSSAALEKASQTVQGFDIIEISARALELQTAGFDLSTASSNNTSALLSGSSPAIEKAPQKVLGFDILVLSAQALEAQALTRETAATVKGSTITNPQQSPLPPAAWSIPEAVFQAIEAGEVADISN